MCKSCSKKLSFVLAVFMIMLLILPSFAFSVGLNVNAVRTKNFISWMGQNDLAEARAKLPATIKCTLSDASVKYLPVTWSANSTPAFNGNAYGNYVFTGDISCPKGITNTSGLKAYATVKVRCLTITSILTINTSVAFNTSLADVKTQLGTTIKVNLNDGTRADYNVIWCADTIPTYSANFPARYQLLGQVMTPLATTRNPLHLRPAVNITVLPPTALAITGVTATNTNTINVTFNQVVPNAGAIAAAGNRILLNKAGGTTGTPTLRSNAIVFAAGNQSATVTLITGTDAGIRFGESYTCILVDEYTIPPDAVPVCTYNCGVLMAAMGAPTAAISADLTKLDITYSKSMNAAAIVSGSYVIFDSSNIPVPVLAGPAALLNTTAIPQTAAELDLLNPAPPVIGLKAGQTYKVWITGPVAAVDGTTILDAYKIFFFNTPSVAAVAPSVVAATITAPNRMVITFDRTINSAALPFASFAIQDYSGHLLPVAAAALLGLPGGTTSLQIILAGATPDDQFQAGQSYRFSLPANLVWNSYYINAFNQAVVNYPISDQARVPAALTSLSLVRNAANPASGDLIMVFDRAVVPFDAIAGNITFNVIYANGNPPGIFSGPGLVELYPADPSGKTLIFRNATTAFGYASAATDTIQVRIGTGVIQTSCAGLPPVVNTWPLVGNMTGINVGTPAIRRATMVNDNTIKVQFDRNVDGSYLTPAGIQVLGFARVAGGVYNPAVLTGASQIACSVSGDTVTITNANPAALKFQTGRVGGAAQDIVIFAANTIKDAAVPALINAAPINVNSGAATTTDSAAPVLIQANATAATSLDLMYTEDGAGGADATQFSAAGVAIPGQAVGVGVWANNVLPVTFGAGTFAAATNYSAAAVSYTGHAGVGSQVVDFAAIPNAAASGVLTGIFGF